MATKMAETFITIDASGNQIRHSNPATHPLAPGAGQTVVAAAKTIGNPNGIVHGQVNPGGVTPGPIVHNPA